MSQRLYDVPTAEALMKFAYPGYGEHDLKPYEIREDGVYVTDAFRDACPTGTIYNWKPADEMRWPGNPNPDTAPFLPIPFNATQLAAAMIDGPGQSIAHAMGYPLGHPLDDEALNVFPDRMRWMRDALAEAYAAAATAQTIVGPFDHQAEARAHKLAERFDEANGQANEREGVFAPNISEDERRARRERAIASVSPLEMVAQEAQEASTSAWRQWRAAMVQQLLNPAPPKPTLSEAESKAEEQGFLMGLYSHINYWANLNDIPANDAAKLLCGFDPLNERECAVGRDFLMLQRLFQDHSQSHPGRRRLAQWWELAASWKAAGQLEGVTLNRSFGEALELYETQRTLDSEPAQASTAVPAPVVAESASNARVGSITTAQVASIFDGMPYTAENWPKRLSDTKWVKPAQVELGAAGGATSLWNPATLAQLIHGRQQGAEKQKTLEALNRKFKSNPVLEPWRTVWNEHYEMFNDTDEP